MNQSNCPVLLREPLRRVLLVLAFFLVNAIAATLASAATTAATFSRTDYPILGNNHVAADFNGDGRLDLAGAGGTAVKVQLANGEGTFAAAVSWPVASSSQDLAAGDFNGDGKVDLAVTINDPAIGLSLLIGNGDGTFRAPVNFPNTSGFDSPTIVATDLNNDGRLDVVIGHQIACFTAPCRVARNITVMLGNGDGTFQPARDIDIGIETAKIAVGDFNRNGIKDLAIASSRTRVTILLGAGDGTFVQQPTLTLISENNLGMDATDIDVADFNRDTFEDLVVAVALNGSRTAILTGNGDGTFRMPPLLITEPNLRIPQYQAVGDFNGDTFLDLALALGDGSGGLFEILNGNGDGTFQAPKMYFPPPDRSSVGGISLIAAQLTSDSRPDLVLVVGGANVSSAVFINTTGLTPPPTPAAPTLVSPGNDATATQPVTFDWADVANASAYEIQVDDSSTFAPPFRALQNANVSQATIGSLPPGVRLWWRVRARNSAGVFGPFSAARRFTASAVASSATLAAVAVNPTSVVGGQQAQGTVTLTSAAPSGGALVTLSSSNAGAVMLPPNVTVAAGATSSAFTVTTQAVAASTLVTLSGTYGDATRSTTLTVVSTAEPAALSAVSVNPASVTGGATSQGNVTLSAPAPAGGFAVALSSNNAAVTPPSSVAVAQGASSATFAVATTAVSASTAVTLAASAAGVTRTTILAVTPPAQTAMLTVTATGRSGERIASNPAGINVAVGSSGVASFPNGTAITLSATNGRDVIWSGACSSGGNKTRSCTFTVTTNASVTGNVQ
jgi:hypothetical protein